VWVYFTTFLIALFGSLLLTPLAKSLGQKIGAMDTPTELSIHSSPVPRVGGLAMVIAFLVAASYAAGIVDFSGPGDEIKLVGVLIGGVIVCGIGFLGDTGRILTKIEFMGVIIPSAITMLFGMKVKLISSISVPLTLFYLVGSSCAMNLLDGMDGLAAGVAAITSIFFAVISLSQGNELGMILSLPLLGSSLGFLPYNFYEAKTFMGDAGSLFLGLMLGCLAVLHSSKPHSLAHFAVPVLILGVPVFDTFLAVTRRALNRRRVLAGDRRHFYDLVRAKGIGDKMTVLVMYGLSLGGGITALIVPRVSTISGLILSVAELSIMCLAAKQLGAFELDQAS